MLRATLLKATPALRTTLGRHVAPLLSRATARFPRAPQRQLSLMAKEPPIEALEGGAEELAERLSQKHRFVRPKRRLFAGAVAVGTALSSVSLYLADESLTTLPAPQDCKPDDEDVWWKVMAALDEPAGLDNAPRLVARGYLRRLQLLQASEGGLLQSLVDKMLLNVMLSTPSATSAACFAPQLLPLLWSELADMASGRKPASRAASHASPAVTGALSGDAAVDVTGKPVAGSDLQLVLQMLAATAKRAAPVLAADGDDSCETMRLTTTDAAALVWALPRVQTSVGCAAVADLLCALARSPSNAALLAATPGLLSCLDALLSEADKTDWPSWSEASLQAARQRMLAAQGVAIPAGQKLRSSVWPSELLRSPAEWAVLAGTAAVPGFLWGLLRATVHTRVVHKLPLLAAPALKMRTGLLAGGGAALLAAAQWLLRARRSVAHNGSAGETVADLLPYELGSMAAYLLAGIVAPFSVLPAVLAVEAVPNLLFWRPVDR